MMSDLPPGPPETRWENTVSEFLDQLVESDVQYIDIQHAIERLIQHGLGEKIAVPLGEFEGETVFWHPLPDMFPGMRRIHIFWTKDKDGGVTVIHAEPAN
jgi:hypothetical protein